PVSLERVSVISPSVNNNSFCVFSSSLERNSISENEPANRLEIINDCAPIKRRSPYGFKTIVFKICASYARSLIMVAINTIRAKTTILIPTCFFFIPFIIKNKRYENVMKNKKYNTICKFVKNLGSDRIIRTIQRRDVMMTKFTMKLLFPVVIIK